MEYYAKLLYVNFFFKNVCILMTFYFFTYIFTSRPKKNIYKLKEVYKLFLCRIYLCLYFFLNFLSQKYTKIQPLTYEHSMTF